MSNNIVRDVFLSSGHSNVAGRDRGASGNGYIEGELTVELRDLIAQHLGEMCVGVWVDDNRNITSETIRYFKNKTSTDALVIDIHWNAATPSATGTETLVPKNSTKFEDELAYKLSDTISRTLDIPKRGNHKGYAGVKSELDSHHGRLGWMRLTGQNVLIEVCFITNPDDMAKYQANKAKLSYLLAKDIYEKAIEPVSSDEVYYTVQSGDSLSKIAQEFDTSVDELQRKNDLNSTVIQIGQVLKIK